MTPQEEDAAAQDPDEVPTPRDPDGVWTRQGLRRRPRDYAVTQRQRERERLRADAVEVLRLPDFQLRALVELGWNAANRSDPEEFRQTLVDREVDAYVQGAESATDRDAQRAYAARSMVLALVVLAVVAMPVFAIIKGLDPDSFGTFIAPVTGIAGTVVGFWFSDRSRLG